MVKVNFNQRTTIDAEWQTAIRDAVSPANPIQAAALHYATVTGAMPIRLTNVKEGVRGGMTGYVKLPEADLVVEEISLMTEHHNIGLRLPAGVVGIDIDTYDAKNGHGNLAKLETRAGALPPTWSSSRRPYDPDTRSGIYYYRLPEHITRWYVNPKRNSYPLFVSEVCANVETIQLTHRHGTTAPSVGADGLIYTWRRPDGTTEPGLLPPSFAELPVLSDVWVQMLVRNLKRTKTIRSLKNTRTPGETYTRPDYTDDADRADAWCAENIPGWHDQPDHYLQSRIDHVLASFKTESSRHIAMRDGIWHLLHTAIGNSQFLGHPGGRDAVDQISDEFLNAKPNARNDAARAFANAVDRISEQIEAGELKPLPQSSFRFNTGGTRNV
jgi:hypothetical protein